MSRPKFAPMTSSLLARKGEALPSLIGTRSRLREIEHHHIEDGPAFLTERAPAPHGNDHFTGRDLHLVDADRRHEERHPPAAPDGTRKLFLRLSAQEYERLGIAAVKKGLTRNDILRDAVNSYIAELVREYQDSCGCISGSAARCGDSL